MIVYHGATERIEKPDIFHSRNYLDFGKGFYLTTYEEQARKWAIRKGMRQEKNPFVNVYQMKDDWKDYRVLSFANENSKWLEFICGCRKGEPLNQKYDIIIGNVADDDVFKTVDLYFRGIWSKEKVLNELRYCRMNDQICIVAQNVLEQSLHFERAYEVK